MPGILGAFSKHSERFSASLKLGATWNDLLKPFIIFSERAAAFGRSRTLSLRTGYQTLAATLRIVPGARSSSLSSLTVYVNVPTAYSPVGFGIFFIGNLSFPLRFFLILPLAAPLRKPSLSFALTMRVKRGKI